MCTYIYINIYHLAIAARGSVDSAGVSSFIVGSDAAGGVFIRAEHRTERPHDDDVMSFVYIIYVYTVRRNRAYSGNNIRSAKEYIRSISFFCRVVLSFLLMFSFCACSRASLPFFFSLQFLKTELYRETALLLALATVHLDIRERGYSDERGCILSSFIHTTMSCKMN